MKKLDALDRLKLLDDTPELIKQLRQSGHIEQAQHFQELWVVSRQLAAEVRQARKGQK